MFAVRRKSKRITVGVAPTMVLILCVFWAAPEAFGSDWPQFMRNSENNGDAADEQLVMPLNLIAQIKLGDAVMNSPAVVGGLVYVVDQMGKAYCVDPDAEPAIVWESAPEGSGAYGSNTASPCVAGGKVYFGTTGGNVHILNAADGNLIKTVSLGSSIVSGLTWANDSVYLQTLDAVVYCLDSDGNERWQWQKAGNIHYGGCVVAVSGSNVVTSVGSNMYCLDDTGTQVWSAGSSSTRYVPTGISISGGCVYTTCSGSDGQGQVRRFLLANGDESVKNDEWSPMCTAAVRGTTMYYSRQAYGVTSYNFGGSANWKSFTTNAGDLTPSVTSPALSQDYCVFTTSLGRLIAVNLAGTGSGLGDLSISPFIFEPPHDLAINSSPAIANGRVYFGCDDGYLYVLGSGPAITPVVEDPLDVHQRKSQLTIAGQRAYPSRGAFGDASNDGYIDDAGFKPPFKLRWAVPSYGTFKHPVCAGDEDIVYVTMSGLVTCREQMTGRLRWMTKLPDQGWSRESLLVGENGKIYVPRSLSPRYPKVNGQPNGLYCLDGDTGEILWMRLMGTSNWQRSSPILLDGVVAYGSLLSGDPVVHRWNADTGVPLPDIVISGGGDYVEGPAGCAGEGLMFFTGGGSGGSKSGETIAIDPATGVISWHTSLPWGSRTGTPVYKDGKLYLSGAYQQMKFCLDASDGTILWQNNDDPSATLVHAASVGPDYLVVAHKYGNKANRFDLSTGVDSGVNLWAPSHGCGSIVLGSEGFAMSAGINGLCIKDSTDGTTLWTSGGFTASTCPHPAVTNGRIFYCPQDDGMLYCFEPAVPVNERPGDMDADYDVDMGDFCVFAGLFFNLACPEAAGCWEANLASGGQVGIDDLEAFVWYWMTDYCTGSPETAIVYGPDDVEETNHNGYMYFDSSDLELINDNRTDFGDQTIGLRFNDIMFKQGADVALAYIQFTAKDTVSGDCSLTVRAEDSDNSSHFGTADFDLTDRPTTTANVSWNPPAWSNGEAGANQRTPNLAALVQEVLGRSGWKCGNSLAFVISGTGLRRAWSFDGSTADAPRLYISAGSGGVPMVATMPATNITDTSATLNGELIYTGGEDTTVIIYYGDNSGGMNPDNWDDSENLGIQGLGSFSTDISGLVSGNTYYCRCYAANSNGQTWADSTESFFTGTPPVDIRVITGNDDAEERASDGNMYLTSGDLEMVYGKDGVHNAQEQIIGIRFQNVTIAPNAPISNAYIQFAVDETSSTSCSLTIKGAATDDAPGFTTSIGNISDRATTTASVNWSPPPWSSAGVSGPDQRTTDISPIVAEIINRPGWSSGNSMVFIISGNSTDGTRSAESYEGSLTAAPLLHVEFN